MRISISKFKSFFCMNVKNNDIIMGKCKIIFTEGQKLFKLIDF